MSSQVASILVDGHRRVPRPAIAAALLVAGALTTIATVSYVDGSAVLFHPRGVAAGRAVITTTWIAGGTYLWWHTPQRRVGLLVAGSGFLWAATALTASANAVPNTVGRLAVAAFYVYLVYIFLCFPRDRLGSPAERRFMSGFGLASAALWLLALAAMPQLPRGGVWSDCVTDCPENAFRLVSAPESITSALSAAVTWFTALALVGAAIAISRKARSPVWLRRRAVEPLLWVTVAQLGVSVAYTVLRPETHESVATLRAMAAVSAVAIPVSIVFGQIRSRAHAASSIGGFVAAADGRITPATVQEFLREAFGDPSLVLAIRAPVGNAYETADGQPFALPAAAERAVTPVVHTGEPVALVVHDSALEDVDLVQGLAVSALTLVENTVLVDELRASRARVASAADRERRSLERDLHDGAQQQLFAIQLRLAAARQHADGAELVHELERIEADTEAAAAELRSLAHGIYPVVLHDRGLAEALNAAIAATPMQIRFARGEVGRARPDVEAAIYFCVLEAIHNAARHAGRDANVTLTLARNGDGAAFSVVDDGVGFDVAAASEGIGLASMRDRIASIGGRLAITSEPGRGTGVSGAVPDFR